MKLLLITKILLLSIFISTQVFAADFYIREDGGTYGSENGSDWTNAFDGFAGAGLSDNSGTTPRGNTYYIAGGQYAAVIFKNGLSGTNNITIKKANATDNSGVSGWSATFASDQTIIGGNSTDAFNIQIRTSYWVFEGVTGSSDTGSTYGIRIPPPNDCSTRGAADHINVITSGSTNMVGISVQHFEIESCGSSYQSFAQRCFKSAESTYTVEDYTFNYNFCHDACVGIHLEDMSNSEIKYNYFKDGWGQTGDCNAEVIATRSSGHNGSNEFSYNIMEAFPAIGEDTTGVVILGKTPDAVSGTGDTDWKIHGNVIFDSDANNGAIGSDSDGSIANSNINNNSIIDCVGSSTGPTIFVGTGTGNTAYNNLWYGSTGTGDLFKTGVGGSITHNYTVYGGLTGLSTSESEGNPQTGITSGIFTDYAGNDFTLSGATTAGDATLGSPYNIDMLDNTRSTDGVWDRGAYEYVDAGTPASPIPITDSATGPLLIDGAGGVPITD